MIKNLRLSSLMMNLNLNPRKKKSRRRKLKQGRKCLNFWCMELFAPAVKISSELWESGISASSVKTSTFAAIAKINLITIMLWSRLKNQEWLSKRMISLKSTKNNWLFPLAITFPLSTKMKPRRSVRQPKNHTSKDCKEARS